MRIDQEFGPIVESVERNVVEDLMGDNDQTPIALQNLLDRLNQLIVQF